MVCKAYQPPHSEIFSKFDHKLATFFSERLGVSNPFGRLIVFVALRITRRDGESISTSLNLNP